MTTAPISTRRAANRPHTLGVPERLERLEQTAFDLATEAGQLIVQSLEHDIEVSYKDTGHGLMAPRDPVSNVDRRVEELLRQRLATRHPDQGFLGEETGPSGPTDHEYLWVVDPVDGTMNFVNGVPLYASTLAVLWRGVPLAGATWCATTHALRPGVYHAHAGGGLGFDGVALRPTARSFGLQRTLSTAPMPVERGATHWDHRHLGSAASESAYVAAGLLASARFAAHRTWDIAAGIVLAQAAGREVWTSAGGRWEPFASFGNDPGAWSHPTLFATSDALTTLRPGPVTHGAQGR